jgi:hypothetical protein
VAALSGAAWFLAGLGIFGVRAYWQWLDVVTNGAGYGNPLNMSLIGWVDRLTVYGRYGSPLWPHATWAPFVKFLGVTAVGVATVRSVWHATDTDRAVLLTLVASLLLAPTGWVYYGWIVVGPLYACLKRGWRPPALVWAFWVPWPLLIAVEASPLWMATVGSAYVIGALALWASLLRTCTPPAASIDAHRVQAFNSQ